MGEPRLCVCHSQTSLLRVPRCGLQKLDDLGRNWVQKCPNWVQFGSSEHPTTCESRFRVEGSGVQRFRGFTAQFECLFVDPGLAMHDFLDARMSAFLDTRMSAFRDLTNKKLTHA